MNDPDKLRAWAFIATGLVIGVALLAWYFYDRWNEECNTTTSGSSDRLEQIKDLGARLADCGLDLQAQQDVYQAMVDNYQKQFRELEAGKLAAETNSDYWQKKAQDCTTQLRESEKARVAAHAELTEARRQRDVAQKERSEANEAAAQALRHLSQCQMERTRLASVLCDYVRFAKDAQQHLDAVCDSVAHDARKQIAGTADAPVSPPNGETVNDPQLLACYETYQATGKWVATEPKNEAY